MKTDSMNAQRERAHTYLHNDVKGKVEQQVTDGDGQQVGGKVIWTFYEAVGSAVVREQDDDEVFASCFKHFNLQVIKCYNVLTETSLRCSPLSAEPSGPETEES